MSRLSPSAPLLLSLLLLTLTHSAAASTAATSTHRRLQDVPAAPADVVVDPAPPIDAAVPPPVVVPPEPVVVPPQPVAIPEEPFDLIKAIANTQQAIASTQQAAAASIALGYPDELANKPLSPLILLGALLAGGLCALLCLACAPLFFWSARAEFCPCGLDVEAGYFPADHPYMTLRQTASTKLAAVTFRIVSLPSAFWNALPPRPKCLTGAFWIKLWQSVRASVASAASKFYSCCCCCCVKGSEDRESLLKSNRERSDGSASRRGGPSMSSRWNPLTRSSPTSQRNMKAEPSKPSASSLGTVRINSHPSHISSSLSFARARADLNFYCVCAARRH